MSQQSSELSVAKPNKPHHRRMVWFVCFTLAAFGLCSANGYLIWQTHQVTAHEIADLRTRLNALKQTQQLHTARIQEATSNAIHQQIDMSTTIKALARQIELVHNPLNDISTQWLLQKARFTLELAQLNAYWSSDTQTTIGLLQTADYFLSQLHDPKLLSIRQALATDLAQQRTTSTFDAIGLLSQLDAIQQLILSNAFDAHYTVPVTAHPKIPTSVANNTWKKRLHMDLSAIKQLFVVTYRPDPAEPLLTPTYKTMQREAIRISLQEAQWAILQRNAIIYEFALSKAIQNMQRTFGNNNPAVCNVIGQLKQLSAVGINLTKVIPIEALHELTRINAEVPAPLNTPPTGPNTGANGASS